MKYLLDTHAFLWFISGNASLSKSARQAIEEINSQSYVSIASLWEIVIKTKIGKLDIGMPFVDLKKHIAANGFDLLPIHFEHLQIITDLPLQHQDPFDRILVAQSMAESLIVITEDPHFKGMRFKLFGNRSNLPESIQFCFFFEIDSALTSDFSLIHAALYP